MILIKKLASCLLITFIFFTSCTMESSSNRNLQVSEDIELLSPEISEIEQERVESESESLVPPNERWEDIDNILKYGNRAITNGTLLTIRGNEITLQEILPNKYDLEENTYTAINNQLYIYDSVFNGVFLTELNPGPGGWRLNYGCLLMDSNNIESQERYIDTGMFTLRPTNWLLSGLISVDGERYGTVLLLDSKGKESSIQLAFDYGLTNFTHDDYGDIPKYYIAFVDYFPEKEQYYALYAETGGAHEFSYGLDFIEERVSNRPLGIAVFDKEGKLLNKWDLDGVYCYEYKVNHSLSKEHALSEPAIYNQLADDGTFLLQTYGGIDRDNARYGYYLVNLSHKSIEEISKDDALQFLRNYDERWKTNFRGFEKDMLANNPFSVKYAATGTYVYQNNQEICMLNGDYMLSFLEKDEYLENTYYLMFQREREISNSKNYLHPYNVQS